MNKNSKLCCFMAEHENWKELLEREYGLKIKEDGVYVIFNYDEFCNFSDPIVQEARGIIIDKERLEVVCWPFRKFGCWDESYADTIDWSTARVQEKIDGSIIKVWYDKRTGYWNVSTNGMILAKFAKVDGEGMESYLDVFQQADNYKDIDYNLLCREYTYIFELVSPQTQVVIRHEKPHLYHIGTRDNTTGKELQVNVRIEQPKCYSLRNLEECKQAAAQLNVAQDGKVHGIQKEGFVVVDANWNRIKVKSADYCMMHHLVSGTKIARTRLISLLQKEEIDLEGMCRNFPTLAHYFKYYDYKVTELSYQADVFADLSRRIFRETGGDRKAVALRIKDHRLAPIGFSALDNEKSGREILAEMSIKQYCRYIPEYVPERLGPVFYGSN